MKPPPPHKRCHGLTKAPSTKDDEAVYFFGNYTGFAEPGLQLLSNTAKIQKAVMTSNHLHNMRK
jgi:hypothetical protein